ncbi:MAG: N-acetyltransferase [Bacteroidales bacterium]|nr:N-acetyltransferase [Bacteroidales bacterium]
MKNVQIVPVETPGQMNLFVDFSIELYKDVPYYVPELKFDTKATLSPKKNPAFEFSEAQAFLAYKDGKVAGRVVALINHRTNETWGEKDVRFGWIDFIEDYDVFYALMETVKEWGKARGMKRMHGPLGFLDTDREGLLVEGYDQMSTMSLAYSYPYYKEFFEKYGLTKGKDWLEYRIQIPKEIPEKYARIAKIVSYKYHLTVGHPKSKKYLKEVAGYEYFDLLNKAYKDLYGFTEISPKQITKLINDYLDFVDIEMLPEVRDENGKLVLVGMMMPSIATAIRDCHGSLFPFGWWKILKKLFIKYDTTLELLLIAMDPEWRSKGALALIIQYIVPVLNRKGFKVAESNANLEDNYNIQNFWKEFDSKQVKRRRAYIKDI